MIDFVIKFKMQIKIFLLLSAALFSLPAGGDSKTANGKDDLTLVRDHKPETVIVIPRNALPIVKFAAEELRHHIRKSTQAKLQIFAEDRVPASPAARIYLGDTEAARQAGINVDALPEDGFIIRTGKNSLFLVGHDSKGGADTLFWTAAGSLFAVYQWLETQLHVHWIFPGELGEVVPQKKDIIVKNCDEKVLPRFRFVYAEQLAAPYKAGGSVDTVIWGRRAMHTSMSRYPQTNDYSRNHAFVKWREKYGKQHPEWFAMDSYGERSINKAWGAMCVSNPGLQEKIVELWREEQKKYPDMQLNINLRENDGNGDCQCRECLALDGEDVRCTNDRYGTQKNVSERYAEFYKKVWELASKYNPDVEIIALGYKNYVYGPKRTKLNKNIFIEFTPDIPFPRLEKYNQWIRGEIRQWQKSGVSLILRPNYFHGGYSMPEFWADQYAEEFKYCLDHGMTAICIDGPSRMWAVQGPNLYVMARLAAHPELSAEQILAEYYSAFGKAEPYVRKYFEYWKDYTAKNAVRINGIYESSRQKWYFHGLYYPVYAHEIFPPEVFPAAFELLKEALSAAGQGSLDEARVKFLHEGLEHALLCVKTAQAFAAENQLPQECEKKLNELQNFRKKMNPLAVNQEYLRLLEKRNWKLDYSRHLNLNDSIKMTEMWRIKPDRNRTGEKERWFKTGLDDTKWQKASSWKPLESQGYKDYRYMWYRNNVTIPERQKGKKVMLVLGAVDDSCWLWVNGKAAGSFIYNDEIDPNSWEKPHEFDVSKFVDFGKVNQFTVLLGNLCGQGGIWKPSYIDFRKPEQDKTK